MIDPPRELLHTKDLFTQEDNYIVFIVKVNTIKWQIYPDEVFYVKDLLPIRVTISLTVSNGIEGGPFLSVYMSIVLYVVIN